MATTTVPLLLVAILPPQNLKKKYGAKWALVTVSLRSRERRLLFVDDVIPIPYYGVVLPCLFSLHVRQRIPSCCLRLERTGLGPQGGFPSKIRRRSRPRAFIQ